MKGLNNSFDTATLLVFLGTSGLILAVIFLNLAEAAPLTEDIVASYPNSIDYDIKRKGRNIGSHSVKFTKTSDSISVSLESKINVRILGLSVFNFNYRATEIWKHQQLDSVTVDVNENRKKWRNVLHNTDYQSELQYKNKQDSVALLTYSSNHWHPGVLGQNRIYNTLTGMPAAIRITKAEKEVLSLPAGSVTATRYDYSGEIEASSWYDSQGRWVKLEFKGDDGSNIQYLLATSFALP